MSDRSFLTWKIQDAMMRMMSSPDVADKLKWAKTMNAARRERGDFDCTRPPCAAPSEPNGVNPSAKVAVTPTRDKNPEQDGSAAASQEAARRDALRRALDRPGDRYSEEDEL